MKLEPHHRGDHGWSHLPFLIPQPSDIGLRNPNEEGLPEKVSTEEEKAISFLGALTIPGVI